MSSISENIKQQFNSGSMVIKLVMVNVGFFIVSLLVSILIKLGNPSFEIANYYGASSNFMELIFKPWTIVTYMFAHSFGGISHLFWNMIMLYFSGSYFVNKIGNKKLLSLYLAGGIAGYLLFALGFNFLPAFSLFSDSFLIGASASVTTIMVVIGVLYPNDEIRLMFIPQPIKLIYIVGFFILLDFIKLQASIGLEGANQGGWLSHLGGAFFGFFYATRMKQGKNILKRFEIFLDNLFSLNFPKFFVKKNTSKLKVEKGGKPPRDDYNYNENKVKSQQQTDVILDKISKSGYESLSKKEKDFLFKQSKK
ncbi:rhomboid family intramembrane serine protease [Flavobacteriales bacterium]|nr:rhomboid family intramembrane serine protease [Flavobacteriales bacterium]MDB4089314.1 rhomboid family intramembrane serine protease [Flavobacteriales bacterium]